MTYNSNNVFAKIINGEIKAEKLYEDDKLIAIQDINPSSPIHILVIPKGNFVDFEDFVNRNSAQDVQYYFQMVNKIAKDNGAEEYRIISNKGQTAGQSVFHFHTHILSGMSDLNLINKNI